MRNRIIRAINTAWFGLGLPEVIWPNPTTERVTMITAPPFGPGDPRYHRGFKVEDIGPLSLSALSALDAVGKLL